MPEKKKKAPAKRVKKKSAPIDTKKCYFLVSCLINQNGRTSVPAQIKMAQKLLDQYGFDLLKFIANKEKEKKFRPFTLAYYLSDKGKETIIRYKRLYENDLTIRDSPKEDLTLSEKPLYSNESFEKRSTVFEFLNNYGKDERRQGEEG